MAEVKVYYDKAGNTLTVWFAEPTAEYISEETGEEVVLIKNRQGNIIGFERLNFHIPDTETLRLSFETAIA